MARYSVYFLAFIIIVSFSVMISGISLFASASQNSEYTTLGPAALFVIKMNPLGWGILEAAFIIFLFYNTTHLKKKWGTSFIGISLLVFFCFITYALFGPITSLYRSMTP